jgi:type III restriction enzyme
MKEPNKILNEILKLNDAQFYRSNVPDFIYSNLRSIFIPRPYQQEAFGRFVFYWERQREKNTPTQLLFHMATGSGKTLIMAGLIIFLFQKGYRNFLFFVNSTNIVEKTKDNFFNPASSKYLFADSISIGGKQIEIKEVDNFQSSDEGGINIVFSTIQGLHSKLNTPRENSLTYEDFQDNKIVFISDEAHHINAETKKKNLPLEEKENILSWEQTVNRIFNSNIENVLLEFTATVDFSLPEIFEKYRNKLLFDYPLKQFRLDGYSKEVKLLQSGLLPFDRAFQGILLSQYRKKIFEKNKKYIKPVILFKSRTIKESEAFFVEFESKMKRLEVADLKKNQHSQNDSVIRNIFKFLQSNQVSLDDFVEELKDDFSPEKLISVNSKNESEQKQWAINSLEREENLYRSVFAVDKLIEGWDVLNLFDIVCLYDTKATDRKPVKTTMAEAQLIGRGARYCPFQITDAQPYFKRKFDNNPDHELKIGEELFYHCGYNPVYIRELNDALIQIGIKSKDDKQKIIVQKNKKEKRPDAKLILSKLIAQPFVIILKNRHSVSADPFDSKGLALSESAEREYNFSEVSEPMVRKAINQSDFCHFANLKKMFPDLNSISQWIHSSDYLNKIKIRVLENKNSVEPLTAKEKLGIVVKVLDEISFSLSRLK